MECPTTHWTPTLQLDSNNNVAGFTPARFVSDVDTITTLSIDPKVTHPEMGEITAVLTYLVRVSPSTMETMRDRPISTATSAGSVGRISHQQRRSHSFYGETTEGIWSLNITDNLDATADGDVFLL